MARYKPSLYLVSILLFLLILPVVSVFMEWTNHHDLPAWPLIGKWFVFWAVGVRLFIAGFRQVSKPSFTAKEIFHISGTESFVIIRELGFSNISIGLGGILSVFIPQWTEPAAVIGGLFYGLAGIQHLVRKPVSANESIAMISDLFIFILLLLYVIFMAVPGL